MLRLLDSFLEGILSFLLEVAKMVVFMYVPGRADPKHF